MHATFSRSLMLHIDEGEKEEEEEEERKRSTKEEQTATVLMDLTRLSM